MKKTYITPVTEINQALPLRLLVDSGVKGKVDDYLDIGFGGTDEDGSKDPSANYGNWDKESWDKL